MNEVAIKIDSISDFTFVDNIILKTFDAISETDYPFKEKIISLLSKIDFQVKNIYVGSEFCQYKIPDFEFIYSVYQKCKSRNLKLTLLTPPVTDYGIKKLKNIFKGLKNCEIEIEFNDVGTLQLLKDFDSNSVDIIAGRIMDKTPHDIRINKKQFEAFYQENGMNYLRNISLQSQSFCKLFSSYNITSLDIDLPLQGIEININHNQKVGIFFPYGYITTGRLCEIKLNEQEEKMKYDVFIPCKKHYCDYINMVMTKQKNECPIDLEKVVRRIKLLKKGNTIFYPYTEEQCSINNYEGASRIILLPKLML